MALPTIPTSFVPHAAPGTSGPQRNGSFVLGLFAYGIFGIVFVLALGVFFYDRILAANKAADDAALATAEKSIDQSTVEGFVRLRDRLDSSQMLLKEHVAFSNFFTTLESVLPSNVRFTMLHLSIDTTGATKLDGSGVAKSFNALAAASTAFATDGRIKDVIFSNISVNKDSSVSFTISAILDPKLVAYTP